MFYGGKKGSTGKWLWVLILGSLLSLLLLLVIGCSRWNRPTDRQGKAVPSFRWDAGDVKGFLTNARYLELMGRPSMALKELEEAHRLFPRDVKVADALAHYYEKLGLSREAQEIYRDALAVAPDNPTLWNNLGFSYYQSGDQNRAEECYRKALAAQPNYEAGRNNLGLLLCRLGRQQEARRLWQAQEGEAAAATKISLALTALGLTPETHYAGQRPSPATGIRPRLPQPAAGLGTISPAEPAAPLAPTPSRPVARQLAPAASPAPTPPEVAAGKLAAVVLPQTKPALSGQVQTPAAPLRPQLQSQAPAPPAITSPDSSAAASPRKVAAVKPSPPAPALPSPASGPQPTTAGSRARRAITRALVPPPAGLKRPQYLTAGELMGTNIVILNGNGIQNLARRMRSRLSLEGFTIAAIGNFRDFGVDQTVIYYQPWAEHVAATLNHDFFPQAVLQPASRLSALIDVKVVLGHDFPSPVRAAACLPQPGQS